MKVVLRIPSGERKGSFGLLVVFCVSVVQRPSNVPVEFVNCVCKKDSEIFRDHRPEVARGHRNSADPTRRAATLPTARALSWLLTIIAQLARCHNERENQPSKSKTTFFIISQHHFLFVLILVSGFCF